ncbi:two-component sensor histidine kinase [Actinorhabdospora filicis]|uniref:histidine kinase n=1 Tax=Actinorhabdospora filicis TaxID=1785913 RepID=A0A9W6WAS7_9ACTN|nr:sensor histidine kinase [Actinorhabdospora filicis]GLZ79954.1 two-component sensor histidine kinase [Actinorhabdospora filicis]
MTSLRRARDLFRARPVLADLALAALVYGLLLVASRIGPERTPEPLTPVAPPFQFVLMMAFPLSLALLLRRRHPLVLLAITLGGVLAYLVISPDTRRTLDIFPAIAMYSVAVRTPRLRAWLTGGAAALVLTASYTAAGARTLTEALSPALAVLLATAIGDGIRNRRAYIASVEERARQAEATREQEAERRVMEERLHIARELHDVLAHHIALINVQAQVAAHVLGSAPEQAREALGHVQEAGREALDELRTTVGLLRRPGSADEDAPTEPSPGLSGLPGLLASFRAAGHDVRGVTEGEPRPLSAQVELTAFRIAQEALTNVSKHAPGAAATVRIAYEREDLLVQVSDDGPGGAALGTGHGLIGMRERALSVEGTFQAGTRPGGGFLVRAVLPAPEVAA